MVVVFFLTRNKDDQLMKFNVDKTIDKNQTKNSQNKTPDYFDQSIKFLFFQFDDDGGFLGLIIHQYR